MNNILLSIKDLAYHVERPIIFDIVNQLMEITEISNKTPIRIHGEEDNVIQRLGAIDSNDENYNKWPYDENVSIEVSEDFNMDRVLSTAVMQEDNILIFKDVNLDTTIKPVYGNSDITITFKYRAPDKNTANSWRNTIKTKTSAGRSINLHSINYSYHLPDECIILLREIHRLRENVAGYNESFDQYFSEKLSNRANLVSSSNGLNAHWVLTETQTRVQGIFDFQAVPDKPEREDDSSAWLTTFTYKFSYEKPIHVNMVYPSMIHNQLLDKYYRADNDPYSTDAIQSYYSRSGHSLKQFESDYNILQYIGNKGISIPSFDDDFLPGSIPSSTVRVFTALCNITPTDKKSLFNFKELGEFSLNDSVLDFIKADKDYIVKTYGSILNLHLYENKNIKKSGSLIIDDNLNVSSVEDLDLRKTYRVRLSLIADINFLNGATIKRIKNYNVANPIFAKKIVNSLNSILKDIGAHSDIRNSALDLNDLVKLGVEKTPYSDSLINPVNNPLYNEHNTRQKLVQNFFVVAEPR